MSDIYWLPGRRCGRWVGPGLGDPPWAIRSPQRCPSPLNPMPPGCPPVPLARSRPGFILPAHLLSLLRNSPRISPIPDACSSASKFPSSFAKFKISFKICKCFSLSSALSTKITFAIRCFGNCTGSLHTASERSRRFTPSSGFACAKTTCSVINMYGP